MKPIRFLFEILLEQHCNQLLAACLSVTCYCIFSMGSLHYFVRGPSAACAFCFFHNIQSAIYCMLNVALRIILGSI